MTAPINLQKYDFDINNIKDTDKIISILKEYGICRIPNYLKDESLTNLKEEVETIVKKNKNRTYEFGNAIRLTQNSYINKHKNITSVFKNKKFDEIAKKYMGKPTNLNSDVFITHDYIADKGLARNGFLHFDRTYTFKFFIYLTDVNEDSGPFSVIPKSHKVGKDLRKKTTGNYDNQKNRILLDYPNLGYKETDIVPILGEKGDLIIFETDLFHMGGVTKNGGERLIIRGHCR